MHWRRDGTSQRPEPAALSWASSYQEAEGDAPERNEGQCRRLESLAWRLKGLSQKLRDLHWKPGDDAQDDDEDGNCPEGRKQPKLLQRTVVTMKLTPAGAWISWFLVQWLLSEHYKKDLKVLSAFQEVARIVITG